MARQINYQKTAREDRVRETDPRRGRKYQWRPSNPPPASGRTRESREDLRLLTKSSGGRLKVLT